MSKFIPTRRNNPCEICSDTSGKCRQVESVRLCMTIADAVSGATVPGYKFIGQTKDGLWGKFVEDDGQDWAFQQRQEWREEQERLRRQRAAEEEKRRAAALPALERDRLYRKLLSQLTLHPADRADLKRRGLSDEQIEQGGFKSVEQWQQLEAELPYQLPGINLDGLSLNTQPGYLCPIKDADGRIVGCQIRLRSADDGGRYRWLTSATKKRPNGPTPHLPNGELPLAVHRPLEVKLSGIGMTEGTGVKPFKAAQRLGQTVIGAAGGQFAASPQTLKLTLEQLGSETVDFYPDAAAIGNRNVIRQYKAVWELLGRWGYQVRVAWWGQSAKDDPDIDELENLDAICYITPDEFLQIAAARTPTLDWLGGIKQWLKSAIGRRQAVGFAPKQHKPKAEATEYAAGDRLQTWANAVKQGRRYILDPSATGTGKSFECGNAEPSLFGARQVIYLSDQHRNPTVASLSAQNGWTDLEARHGGLIGEATPNGNTRLKRVAAGEIPSISANCYRHQVVGVLRAKGVDGADSAAVICGTCPLKEACTHAAGAGYGFLFQRRNALSSPKLRAHPLSLPDSFDYNYDDVVLLWDEPGQIFQTSQQIAVTLPDLQQTTTALMLEAPNLFEQVRELLNALHSMLAGDKKLPKFGLNHHQVKELLSVPNVDLDALERVLQPSLAFLNTTAEYGADLADLPTKLRKQFSIRDSEMADQAKQEVIKQWLPELLRVLTNKTNGALHLNHNSLVLTLRDTRQAEIADQAKANIFLDATLTREDLALKLGVDPEEILVVKQIVPNHNNLVITQIVDLGRMGMQRGADQQRRAAALVKHYQSIDPNTKVIDFKRYVEAGMGVWWRDSRGVNDFERVSTLMLVGTPCRTLSALAAEYAVLTGAHPGDDDPDFQAYVDRAILADFHQAIGRLRSHRRSSEQLQVIIISNFALDLPVQHLKASDVTQDAATKAERVEIAIRGAVQQLQAEGQKITQQAIATITGLSQGYISRFRELLVLLLNDSNSKTNNFSENNLPPDEPPPDPPDLDDLRWMSEQQMPLLASSPPQEMLEGVQLLFEICGSHLWRQVWDATDANAQVKILQTLMFSLGVGELRSLAAALEIPL